MAAYCRVDDLSAGWLPVHRDQPRAQRSVTSVGSLYPFLLRKLGLSARIPKYFLISLYIEGIETIEQ